MRYRMLGRTGLFVSQLSLGTMTFGENRTPYGAAGWLDEDEALPIFRRSIEAGINFIDTANVYAGGRSEEITGRALKALGIARHDVILATKAEHPVGPGPNDAGATRHHLLHEVRQSLRRLDTDYIDLYVIHGWDPVTPLDETVRVLDDCVRQGLIRYVGVSNWMGWQMMKALGVAERLNASPIQCHQGYYSLAARDIEREIIPMLEAEGVGLTVYSPLAGGYLTGKYRRGEKGRRDVVPFPPVDEVRGEGILHVLSDIAANKAIPMATAALAWLLHQPVVTSVILGAKCLEQLDDQLRANDVEFMKDELMALDAASALVQEYPRWALDWNNVARTAISATGKLPDNMGVAPPRQS